MVSQARQQHVAEKLREGSFVLQKRRTGREELAVFERCVVNSLMCPIEFREPPDAHQCGDDALFGLADAPSQSNVSRDLFPLPSDLVFLAGLNDHDTVFRNLCLVDRWDTCTQLPCWGRGVSAARRVSLAQYSIAQNPVRWHTDAKSRILFYRLHGTR